MVRLLPPGAPSQCLSLTGASGTRPLLSNATLSKVQSLPKDFPSAWSKLSQKHTAVWDSSLNLSSPLSFHKFQIWNYHLKALPDNSCSLPSSFTGISTPTKEKKISITSTSQPCWHLLFPRTWTDTPENILRYLIYWQSATGLVRKNTAHPTP